MIESLGDVPDARGLDALAVRCKQSVCRIDAEAPESGTLASLLDSSRAQQPHVTYQLALGDADAHVEAYLARERGSVGDDEEP